VGTRTFGFGGREGGAQEILNRRLGWGGFLQESSSGDQTRESSSREAFLAVSDFTGGKLRKKCVRRESIHGGLWVKSRFVGQQGNQKANSHLDQ